MATSMQSPPKYPTNIPKEWNEIVLWIGDWFQFINKELGRIDKDVDDIARRLKRVEQLLNGKKL